MEYDRALFRVYERIMEDLNASPSPLAAAPLPSASTAAAPTAGADADANAGGRRRRSNPGRDEDAEAADDPGVDGDPSDGDDGENSESPPGRTSTSNGDGDRERRRQRRRRRQRDVRRTSIVARRQFLQGQRLHEPLPFVLPIWMARKLGEMNRSSLFGNGMTASDSNSSFFNRLWGNVRAVMAWRGGVMRSSYVGVATSSSPQRRRPASGLSLSLSPAPSFDDHRDNFDDNGAEEGAVSLELPPLDADRHRTSSGEGLRRRSPTRHDGEASPTHSPSISTSSSSESASFSFASRQSAVDGDRRNATFAPAPARSLAQRAIQMQLLQSERLSSRRRRGRRSHESEGGESGSSSDYDTESDYGTSSDDGGSGDGSEGEDDPEGEDDREVGDGVEGCSQNTLYVAMRLSFVVAVFHVFVLVALHATYVGPYAFRKQETTVTSSARGLTNAAGKEDSSYVRWLDDHPDGEGDEDGTMTLNNCISYALATRPAEDRSAYAWEEKDKKDEGGAQGRLLEDTAGGNAAGPGSVEGGQDIDGHYLRHGHWHPWSSGNHGATTPRSMEKDTPSTTATPAAGTDASKSERPLLGKDEILQIKILYGGKCSGRCSRVHKVIYPTNATVVTTNNGGVIDNSTGSAEDRSIRSLSLLRQRIQEENKGGGDGATKEDDTSSPSYWEKVHYRFAMDDALLFLDDTSAWLHNITVVNVTVTERCLSTGSDDGKLTFLMATGQFLSKIYGMDSIIINQLMYGVRGKEGAFTSGHVKSMETQERWGWHKEQLESFEHRSFTEWVMKKIGVVSMSALAFFLITSVTALIVRVLTSSGVVLMFPLFAFFRSLGMPGADERILSLSYPWIGSARLAIASGRVHPQSHLVCSHVTKIVLYYVMYEACQAAWSVVLYAKSIPEALPVWIYGFAMIWEYFSMVFVRSALSVHLFPRLTSLYFFLYHAYFYSVPYGHFDVALIPLFLLMLHAMLYTILGLEAPNAARGVVNVECPREVYNGLSWREPVAALPPEWTIFLPLNSRLSPLHDRAAISDGVPINDANNGRNESDSNAEAD